MSLQRQNSSSDYFYSSNAGLLQIDLDKASRIIYIDVIVKKQNTGLSNIKIDSWDSFLLEN